VLQFYLDLMRATFWTSAGIASRLLFLGGLVIAVLGLLNPEVTKAFGASADIPRLWGLAPLAAISLYSFLNENYRRAHALQTRVALSEQIPKFKFSISSDAQMSCWRTRIWSATLPGGYESWRSMTASRAPRPARYMLRRPIASPTA
jgi:hypothetical protein